MNLLLISAHDLFFLGLSIRCCDRIFHWILLPVTLPLRVTPLLFLAIFGLTTFSQSRFVGPCFLRSFKSSESGLVVCETIVWIFFIRALGRIFFAAAEGPSRPRLSLSKNEFEGSFFYLCCFDFVRLLIARQVHPFYTIRRRRFNSLLPYTSSFCSNEGWFKSSLFFPRSILLPAENPFSAFVC